jgi:peroxiredoxin
MSSEEKLSVPKPVQTPPPAKPYRLSVILPVVVVGFILAVSLVTARQSSGWIGKHAPDFELADLDGNHHRLSDLRGKRVFLVFWGTNCGPCLEEIPTLVALRNRLPKEEFTILAFTGDDADFLRQRHVVDRLHINYPVISYTGQVDKVVPPYRNVSSIPTLMVVSPEGRFEAIKVGGRTDDELFALARGGRAS